MIVELEIFSGRPNPRWELKEEASETLWQLVKKLPPASPDLEPPEPPGLGYRGFHISGSGRIVHAFNGRVSANESWLEDPQKTIERWLLAQLPQDFAALASVISAAIASGSS